MVLLLSIVLYSVQALMVPDWIQKGSYLVYDVVRITRFYGVPSGSAYAMYFKNTTYWGRIKYEIISLDENEFKVFSVVIDTNDTLGEVFKVGENTTFTIPYNSSLKQGVSIYINPELLPENNVYVNSTSGVDPYGRIYNFSIEARFEPETGILKHLEATSRMTARFDVNTTIIGVTVLIFDLVEKNKPEETANNFFSTNMWLFAAGVLVCLAAIAVYLVYNKNWY